MNIFKSAFWILLFCIVSADASAALRAVSGVSAGNGVPGGIDGQVQYNNNGVFGGIASTGSGNIVRSAAPTLTGLTTVGSLTAGTSVTAAANLSAGTKFTISGCTAGTTIGGASAGSFVSGTTGTCTVVITINGATGLAAANGWVCYANDQTTPADLIHQTASNTTTATLSGTTLTNDVISFGCMGY